MEAIFQLLAIMLNSPVLEFTISPSANKKSPISAICLKEERDCAPTSFLEIMIWRELNSPS